MTSFGKGPVSTSKTDLTYQVCRGASMPCLHNTSVANAVWNPLGVC